MEGNKRKWREIHREMDGNTLGDGKKIYTAKSGFGNEKE
jgi:hypothetical protein